MELPIVAIYAVNDFEDTVAKARYSESKDFLPLSVNRCLGTTPSRVVVAVRTHANDADSRERFSLLVIT